jgi:phospholipase/carboxylesterase
VSGLVLETVEVEPAAAADSAVILLHGLGADGHDFEPIARELAIEPRPALRWVFPHAPVRPVTLNAGQRMRAWYDIVGLDRRAPEDEAGLRESAAAVRALVEREGRRGIPAGRIVLAGFSQGGALALFTALREPERLAGVVALSSYLPLPSRLAAEAHPANAAVPVFMGHGSHDLVVAPTLGEGSRDALRARGYDVEWHSYSMPHSVSAEEVDDLRGFLQRVLPARR